MNWIKFMSIFFFIFSSLFCFGQIDFKDLEVPLKGQRASVWCWAASIEMINGSFQPSNLITQCSIANRHLERIKPSYYSNWAPNDAVCQSTCPLVGPYVTNLESNSNNMNSTNYRPAHFDLILSDIDYYSMEDINRLSWENYKKEIDNCRPVIMISSVRDYDLNGIEISRNPYHAIVSKGYLTFFTDKTENSFFLINDPLDTCAGRQYLLSRTVLTQTVGAKTVAGPIEYDTIPKDIKIGSIKSMVHHITPKNYPCDTCAIETYTQPDKRFANSLVALVLEYKAEFIGTANKGVFSENYIKDFNPSQHFPSPVDYLLPNYYSSNPDKDAISKKKGYIPKNQREVTFKKSPIPLMATIDCNSSGSNCIVEKIAIQEAVPKLPFIIDNQRFYLNNDIQDENFQKHNKTYRIIRYHPYSLSFFQVTHDNKVYLIPKDETAKILFKTETEIENAILAIPEEEAIQGINIYSQLNPIDSSPTGTNEKKLSRAYKSLIKCLEKNIISQKIFKQYVKRKN